MYTWGTGARGVLGHGDEDDEKFPRVLEAVLGRSIRQLSLAGKHSIALEGTLVCTVSPVFCYCHCVTCLLLLSLCSEGLYRCYVSSHPCFRHS